MSGVQAPTFRGSSQLNYLSSTLRPIATPIIATSGEGACLRSDHVGLQTHYQLPKGGEGGMAAIPSTAGGCQRWSPWSRRRQTRGWRPCWVGLGLGRLGVD